MPSARLRVLLIDDDERFRAAAAEWLDRRQHRVRAVGTVEDGLASARRSEFDVAVVGYSLPGNSRLELLHALTAGERTKVLFLAEDATVDEAVGTMKAGASDFILKPCGFDELERRCREAHLAGRRGPGTAPGDDVADACDAPRMIGSSPAMMRLRRLIERVGPSDKPALIEGESGTGKELVAKALLHANGRARKPFVTVNCAALPESLLESEFFGHEKGAFTGATIAKPGLVETADGGTLFVDEIGELALSLQAKLLRVLEDGSFRRVGSVTERRADVRLIAATNRNLAAEVAAGRFREDLYYRINVVAVPVPPLRDREGDLPYLVEHFLGGSSVLDPESRRAIERYRWPGNVRQLKNALDRAKVLCDSGVIRLCDLPVEVAGTLEAEPPRPAIDDMAALERAHVLGILRREGGNKVRAARALGLNRRTLYRMLERWGEHDPSAKADGHTKIAVRPPASRGRFRPDGQVFRGRPR